MKIAVTARSPEITSEVDPHFGRTAFFMVMETEDGNWSTQPNQQNVEALQGAGLQAAKQIVDLGVSVVLTGNMGPKAFAALAAAGIAVVLGAQGSVEKAAAQYAAGQLQPAAGPNRESHGV